MREKLNQVSAMAVNLASSACFKEEGAECFLLLLSWLWFSAVLIEGETEAESMAVEAIGSWARVESEKNLTLRRAPLHPLRIRRCLAAIFEIEFEPILSFFSFVLSFSLSMYFFDSARRCLWSRNSTVFSDRRVYLEI